MRIEYDKIQNAVKFLGSVRDNGAFLKGFLSAFGFPNSTYSRLKGIETNGVNKGINIQGNGGIFFLVSSSPNLNSEFNILKKNNLNKIKEAFIILINDTDFLAYERCSRDVLETTKVDLYRHIEFFFSLLGVKVKATSYEMKSVDKKASEKFAELYRELIVHNKGRDEDITEFLWRLLFCCFADSIGVLANNGLRSIFLNYTNDSASDLNSFFVNLFKALKEESRSGLPGYFSSVQYVDSRLFEKTFPQLNFSTKTRNIILDLLGLDWSDITPDILGALIQSITRDEVSNSCNYTSSSNIRKIIGPLFMDDLYRSFERVKNDRDGCEMLLNRIKAISVFDPSSGTGNFLLVAYKELNKLANKISDVIEGQTISTTSNLSVLSLQKAGMFDQHHAKDSVSWSNFYGIEYDAFSCAITRLGFLFIVCQEGQHKINIKSVFKNTIEVLFSKNIAKGNATKISWEKVCRGNGETYIIGNPSYSGARKQSPAQKADIARVFKGYKKISNLDYAACWFLLATKYICAHGGGYAFVTTNSLTQGEQVQLLWPKILEKDVRIRFAYTSFKWKNDARNKSAVTVVIIGVVPDSNKQPCELYTDITVLEPKNISPYLTPNGTIIKSRSSALSNLPKMVKGNMPLYWSDYLMTHEEMEELTTREPRAKKFLKKVIGSEEFINGVERWCFWIHNDEVEEARSITYIADRIEWVRQKRLASKDFSARSHATHSHSFRENRETTKSSLVVPSVSSEKRIYIPIGFIDKNTIVTNLACMIYDCEPWIFGVVASRMHNVWVRTVCGALETRIRYSSKLGYNTFPFPNVSQEKKDEITRRVFAIIAAREKYSGKTLAELYAPSNMPNELGYAHSLLDAVIDHCYKETPFVSDQERLDCLFELYNKMED